MRPIAPRRVAKRSRYVARVRNDPVGRESKYVPFICVFAVMAIVFIYYGTGGIVNARVPFRSAFAATIVNGQP